MKGSASTSRRDMIYSSFCGCEAIYHRPPSVRRNLTRKGYSQWSNAKVHPSVGAARLPPCGAAAGIMAQPWQPGGAGGDGSKTGVFRSMLTTKYDKEIVSVAVPALAAMLLEPIMSSINAGECHKASLVCA